MNGWNELPTREHTFRVTGRTATLHTTLPSSQLIRQGVLTSEDFNLLEAIIESGMPDDPKDSADLSDKLCIGMFVSPKLVETAEEADKLREADPEADVAPLAMLDESEIMETVVLAFESLSGAASFHEGGGRPPPRGSGKSVAKSPKRAPGVKTRKPAGARSRRSAG